MNLPLEIKNSLKKNFEILMSEAKARKHSAGSGKQSRLAKYVAGLARTNSKELLVKLDVHNYKKKGTNKTENIRNFLLYSFGTEIEGEQAFKILYGLPVISGNDIEIPLAVYETEDGTVVTVNKISRRTSTALIHSLLYAASREEKIDWNEDTDFVETMYGSEESPKIYIRIS